MTKKAQLPCFATHHTLPFRVCSWGAPPQTGAFLCPLPKDPLNLGVWGYKELGSLNTLPLCLTQPLLSVPPHPASSFLEKSDTLRIQMQEYIRCKPPTCQELVQAKELELEC